MNIARAVSEQQSKTDRNAARTDGDAATTEYITPDVVAALTPALSQR
jgi:hypothetical protein